jgi:hypothetical protein
MREKLRASLPTAALVYLAGSTTVFGLYLAGIPNYIFFIALFALTVVLTPPRLALSPLTFLYLYYGAWFVAAPAIAEIYDGVLSRPEYSLAFAFAYVTMAISAIAIRLGERASALSPDFPQWTQSLPSPPRAVTALWLIALLYAVATIAVVLIVLRSGGFATWMANPGDAFLNRGGTGMFVVLSHFASLTLAALTGYLAYRDKKYWLLIPFLAWVVITSPVHGSKLQIALLIVIALSPWLIRARFLSWTTAALAAGGAVIFFAGMLMRHQDLLQSWSRIVATMNYFTALENLAISLRDLAPGLMQTFFMPFNKVGMLFGWLPPDSYFDMNHYLTDIYYPEKWAIKATEQWPVETDLWLNFYFFGGLPIVFLFFAAHGYLFGLAKRLNSMGAVFAITMIMMGMVSHLRGSLYNHVDFYLYPFIAAMFFIMLRWSLNTPSSDQRSVVDR